MKVKYIPVLALIGLLAILSGMPLFSMGSGGIANSAYAKYANTNTQSQVNNNECDTGTNCAITSPQTQGDGTANSPTNLQISKFNEDQAGEPSVGMPVDLSYQIAKGESKLIVKSTMGVHELG